MTTPSGLKIIDTHPGTGASPKTGQTCVMHYTGWLYDNATKGKKFDSSVDRNEPFAFKIGVGQVIRGWDEGVSTMKVGGKRTLIIPPELGYGARGAGGVIPPQCHADLRRRAPRYQIATRYSAIFRATRAQNAPFGHFRRTHWPGRIYLGPSRIFLASR